MCLHSYFRLPNQALGRSDRNFQKNKTAEIHHILLKNSFINHYNKKMNDKSMEMPQNTQAKNKK